MARTASASLDDAELVPRITQGDQAAFEVLMRRHNGRLFRVARAILRDDAEAEDAVQEAYLDALRHIAEFRGGSQLGTWLTRITINQALMHRRRQRRDRVVVPFDDRGRRADESASASASDSPAAFGPREVADQRIESPSNTALRAEMRALLERRIDELPVAFRTVFIMREVEDMTVEETATCLDIPPATVRSRLFRARALLREALARDIDTAAADVFAFAGTRCDRIVSRVLERAEAERPGTPAPSPSSNRQ
jgi:RNA polymerase sigma-70 factor, ECF subfamily